MQTYLKISCPWNLVERAIFECMYKCMGSIFVRGLSRIKRGREGWLRRGGRWRGWGVRFYEASQKQALTAVKPKWDQLYRHRLLSVFLQIHPSALTRTPPYPSNPPLSTHSILSPAPLNPTSILSRHTCWVLNDFIEGKVNFPQL
jgi:hypothetical protein